MLCTSASLCRGYSTVIHVADNNLRSIADYACVSVAVPQLFLLHMLPTQQHRTFVTILIVALLILADSFRES